MSLSKRNEFKIEILEDGTIQVRRADIFLEDDVEIAKSYHRYSFNPGDNVSDQTTRIQNVCAVVWTQDVIDTYIATQAAQDPSVDPNP